MEHVKGIVHTHSPYATSFALLGEPLVIYLTEMADTFGTDVPISDYAPVGGEAIGKEVVSKIGESKAILIRRHGVFTIGGSPTDALKAAVMLEHSAKIVHLALLRGKPQRMSKEEIRETYRRYRDKYGQR
jgi:L-ribulose-5-phosphate 4-epimerase